jgi:hypothetical protein
MGDLEPAATLRLGDKARSTPTAVDEVRKTRLFMPARLTQFAAAQAKPLPHLADCLLHGQKLRPRLRRGPDDGVPVLVSSLEYLVGVDLVLSRNPHNRRTTNKCASTMRRFTSDIRKENILFPRRGWITAYGESTRGLLTISVLTGE